MTTPDPHPGAKPVRLFIAIELPGAVKAALAKLQTALKALDRESAVRWTQPDSIHLTLKFIGETDAANIEAIRAALAAAAQKYPPFDLAVAGAGCFPNLRKPRVVWAGVESDGAALRTLGALRAAIEAGVAPLGYPTENRPFSPHLTLGRIREGAPVKAAGGFGAALEQAQNTIGQLAAWRVSAVSLMQSELWPSGAVYTRLADAELTAAT